MKKSKKVIGAEDIEKEIEEKVERTHEKLERSAEEADKKGEKWIKTINNEKILIWIIVVLVVIFALLSIFPSSLNFIKKEKTYSLEVIKIEGCPACFDLNSISSGLGKIDNVKIKSEKSLEYNSSEAEKLIDKYKIERIPALIVSGNIDKINLDVNFFRKGKNYAIFDKPAPYLELNSGQVKGIVNLKEVFDSSCKDCTSLSNIKTQLEGIQVKVGNYEMVPSTSDNGKKLIEENNIIYLPSLLVSKELNEYWWIFDKIKGSFDENENYYRFAEPLFPNKEISTGLIKGKVRMTYVTNNSCEDCFNVTQLKDSFQNLGVYIDSERYADVSTEEGKSLLNKYNITAIPTVVLSEEISDYTSLKKLLEEVGSFIGKEYVFRKLDVLKVKFQELSK